MPSDSSATQHGSAQANRNTPPKSGRQPQPQRGLLRKVATGTGKAVWKGAALDVLWRDAKRVRPLNPGMWRDVFSLKGWNAAKALVTTETQKRNGEAPKTGGWRRIVLPNVISATIGFAIAAYGLVFVNQIAAAAHVPTINKLIAVGMTSIGVLFGLTSLGCAIIAAVRLIQTRKPDAVRRQK